MAQYVDFPQANKTLKPPPGGEELPDGSKKQADGTVITDLRVFDDGKQLVSCWELSAEELLTVIQTRRIYLFVLGRGHPPVFVQGSDPWAPPPGDFEATVVEDAPPSDAAPAPAAA